MPSLKLSSLFRRNPDRLDLKQRAAGLKASLGRSAFAEEYPAVVEDEPDPIHAVIAESHRVEAEMKAFGLDPAATARPQWFLRERALSEAQSEAQKAVWRTTPTTRAGRLALDYVRFQVALYTGGDTDPDVPAYLLRDIMSAVTAAFEADCAPASDTAKHDLSGCDLA